VNPKIQTRFNDYDVMAVKVKANLFGTNDTDDFFLVLKGVLDIQLRDRAVTLGPGQMYIVPKGIEHRPVAKQDVHLLLIEPYPPHVPPAFSFERMTSRTDDISKCRFLSVGRIV